ncbi:hypothetical protein [Pendulispora albinea]|uniref:Lipoprotein n=1 Tax=Pendulispora albinea TaxID=2741071 RepID=A0ABZ2LTH9_9BACT
MPRTSLRSFFAIGLSAALVMGLPLACSDSDSGTTGKRIVLHTRLTAGAEATAPFTNAQGWNVQLSKLVISTGALRYYEGSPIFSYAPPPVRRSPFEPIRSLFGIREAFAHPGHYAEGTARGEMLTSASSDLRAGVVTLPDGAGVTGLVRSGTFSFNAPPVGAMAQELGGHVAVVEGTASKAGATRIFRAEIDAKDFLDSEHPTPDLKGCPFTETEMGADGTVTVSIQVPMWFSEVDFESLPASTDGKPVRMPSEGSVVELRPRNALVRGMQVGKAYVFSYSAP